jgi:cytochrome c-type biogenesis protein CcmE
VVSGTGLTLGADGLSVRFDLRGDAARLPVEYRGAIPEMFRVDRQVIVEGRMGDDGVFHADVLLTKCASKYEARQAESTNGHAGPGERGTAP